VSDAADPLPPPPEEPPMEFHKPKPVHNWREFLKEYAIIVLGVATALLAEQGVEWLHWNSRVRDAIAAMRIELRNDDGPQAYERIALDSCFAQELDAIQNAIEAGRPRQEIVALVKGYLAPTPTWDSNAWNAVLSSDVGSHTTPDQMIKWSLPYNFVTALDRRNTQEREDENALQPTHQAGEKLSAGEGEAMLAAIARLRLDNRGISSFSRALLNAMNGNGIPLGKNQQESMLRLLRGQFHDCVVVPAPFDAPGPANNVFRDISRAMRNE